MKVRVFVAVLVGSVSLATFDWLNYNKRELQRRRLSPDTFNVGDFIISVEQDTKQIRVVNSANTGRILWETTDHPHDFLNAAIGDAKITEIRGSFYVDDRLSDKTNSLTIESVQQQGSSNLVVAGRLQKLHFNLFLFRKTPTLNLKFTLKFETVSSSPSHLRFVANIFNEDGTPNDTHNRVIMKHRTERLERFFGFGEQFTKLNMKGHAPTIIASENGISRGEKAGLFQKIGFVVLSFVGVAGNFDSAYKPAPYYITDQGRGFFLENYEISKFDLKQYKRVAVTVHSNEMIGRILFGDKPLDLIESYTEYTGRMAKLPDWINQGAVVGMQGGTDFVRRVWGDLQERNTPIAAFWLQDWVGQRSNLFGKQLWWNYILNEKQYPGWINLVSDLEAAGSRVMTYCSPFLADLSGAVGYDGSSNLLFSEARDNGYLVKNEDGDPILIENADFDAGLVDLSNPAASTWYKDVIKTRVLGVGASGYMADFGEALPFTAVLESGESAETYHNRYPEEWAKLNQEAIAEAGRTGEVVFFTRSGYTRSPAFTTLMWGGDQWTEWDRKDGLKSAITALLTSGISGMSLNHNDIGGYTNLLFLITRSKELFQRWAEMNAFTAVFRTHEGIDPTQNIQFYSDDETMDTFVRFAKVYKALAFYRSELMTEAETKGYPLVRHPMLHYPNDPRIYEKNYQWLLGASILVAPVTEPGRRSKRLYIPGGSWTHLWSGKTYKDSGFYVISSPIGSPPVFYKTGSSVGETFVANLKAANVFHD